MGQFLGNVQNIPCSINILAERKTQLSHGDYEVF